MIPGVSLFVFKSKVTKNGEVKIYIRFTKNRRCSYICTNISVPMKCWDFRHQRLRPSYKLANPTNMLLERKMSEIREQLMIKALHSKHITHRQAKSLAIKKSELSFFAIADAYVDQITKAGQVGSADKIRSIFTKFEHYLGNRNITLYEIDETVLIEYQAYLKNKLGNSVTTIHTNLKSIRRVFSIAVEKGIIGIESDPFKKIKLRSEKSIRPFLTEEETKSLIDLKLEQGSSLERSRDVFVWTILSGGMRISDVLLLRKKHIDGQFITTRIKKTGVPHRIKMPPKALEILEKYSASIPGGDGYVFQMVPESIFNADANSIDKAVCTATANYNRDLKKLAKMVGIDKSLSSHIARISFITMAVASGIDMTTVKNIAGHADLEMTAHYSKYVDNQGNAALERLEKNIFQN
jgi:integrase/recombinase XerD